MSHTVLDSKQQRSRVINHSNNVNSSPNNFPDEHKKNSPVVRIVCMTCCSLNGREKDAETSKDLVLDVEGLQKQNKSEYR